MKACLICGVEKELSAFHKQASSADGYRARCKECRKEESRIYARENSAKAVARAKKWAADNPERYRESVNKSQRAWRENNRDLARELWRASYAKNREKRVLEARTYRDANRDKVRESVRVYQKNNRHVANAIGAKRRAIKKMACVSWADHEQIKNEYALAKWCSEVMGIPYHVDHIIPLVSNVVCGLHVHTNLRVIPAKDNQKKHNKYSAMSEDQIAEMAESMVQE